MVSVMLANNETGVIQRISQIAEIVHAASGVLHVDAVQGPGRVDCDIAQFDADLVSISSHKLGGPQGAGALIETAIIAFDLNGIAISSGSACSSGKVQTSHVLTAMGADPALVRGGMRVSLGWSTTDAEIEHFLRTWNVLAGSLLKGRSGIAA